MTRDEILVEPAGVKFDAWIAEHIMGWNIRKRLNTHCVYEWVITPPKNSSYAPWYGIVDLYDQHTGEKQTREWWEVYPPPKYTDDIALAWTVLEKMRNNGMWALIDMAKFGGSTRVALCSHLAEANDAPLAICRASAIAHLSLSE